MIRLLVRASVHLPEPPVVVIAVDVTGLAAWISRDISWKDPLTSAALSCWRSRETIPLIAGKLESKGCEFILSKSGPSLYFFDFDNPVFELDSSDQGQEQELNGLAASSAAQKFAAPATSRSARSSGAGPRVGFPHRGNPVAKKSDRPLWVATCRSAHPAQPTLLNAQQPSADAGISEEGICAVPAVLVRVRLR